MSQIAGTVSSQKCTYLCSVAQVSAWAELIFNVTNLLLLVKISFCLWDLKMIPLCIATLQNIILANRFYLVRNGIEFQPQKGEILHKIHAMIVTWIPHIFHIHTWEFFDYITYDIAKWVISRKMIASGFHLHYTFIYKFLRIINDWVWQFHISFHYFYSFFLDRYWETCIFASKLHSTAKRSE
jgi:hypothetical protein